MSIDRIAAQSELKRICDENGGVLRVEDVVDAARPHNSLLHRYFEWNDSVAAEKYRMEQARHLIKIIVVPMAVEDGGIVTVPLYVHEEDGQGYTTIYDVLDDKTRTYNLVYQTITQAINILNRCSEKKTQKLASLLEKHRSQLKKP